MNWDRAQVAGKELLDQAKEEHGDPSLANTLALIGIGNALLQISEQLDSLGDLRWLQTMVGSLDEIAEDMQRCREKFGFSYYLVSDTQAEELAPLVERVSGR